MTKWCLCHWSGNWGTSKKERTYLLNLRISCSRQMRRWSDWSEESSLLPVRRHDQHGFQNGINWWRYNTQPLFLIGNVACQKVFGTLCEARKMFLRSVGSFTQTTILFLGYQWNKTFRDEVSQRMQRNAQRRKAVDSTFLSLRSNFESCLKVRR